MPTARVGENDIYFEVQGREAPGSLPAVLLMGLGMDLEGWDHVAPRLEPRRLLLIDNRGVGRSAKPPGPYTTRELAEDAAGVMDAAGIGRAHVVGVSLGGAIAQELALGHPGRVASLALLATFASQDAAMRSVGAAAPSAAAIDPRAAYKFLMPLVFSAEFLAREKEMLRERYKHAMARGFSMEGFLGQVAAAGAHDTRDRLPALAVPTLVVRPLRDLLVPSERSLALAAAIPGARLHEIPDGVHGLVIEGAQETAALLRGWLEDNDSR